MRDRWAGKKPRPAAGFVGARNKVWCQVWQHTPEIPALGKRRQEDCKFQVSPGYIRSSQKKKKKIKSNHRFGGCLLPRQRPKSDFI